MLKYIQDSPATILLIATNILVFVFMTYQAGLDFMLTPKSSALINFGANFGPLTTHGQSFRLITCGFIHIGLLHIFMNMTVLGQIGQILEKLVGSSRLIGIYFMGLIGASLTSLWLTPLSLSAGASGAILALIGAFGAFVYRRRKQLPASYIESFKKSSIVYIIYLVIMGTVIPGVDNAAHFGGLFFGFISGLILSPENTNKYKWTLRDTIGMSFILVILFLWWQYVFNNVNNSPKIKGYFCFKNACELIDNHRYTEALLNLNQAKKFGYKDINLLEARAQCNFLLNRFADSLKDCNAIIEQEPKNVKALTLRAFDYRHLNDITSNLADLNRVNQLEPNNAGIYALLAMSYFENNEYQQSLCYAEKVLAAKPQELDFMVLHGFILALEGNLNQGAQEMKKVIDQDPKSGNAYFHLGLVYLMADNYIQAKKYFDLSKKYNFAIDQFEAKCVNNIISKYNQKLTR